MSEHREQLHESAKTSQANANWSFDTPLETRETANAVAVEGRSPDFTTQRQLAEHIHSSPHQAAQRQFAEQVYNSPHQHAQRQFAESIQSSPRLSAQRQQQQRIFGGAMQRAANPEEEDLQHKTGSGQRIQRQIEPLAREHTTGLPDARQEGAAFPAAVVKERPGREMLQAGRGKEKPKDALSEAFKRLYQAAVPDPQSTNLGAGPAAVSFIARGPGAQDSSHHHIFPKAKLTETASELSKWQKAMCEVKNRFSPKEANTTLTKEETGKLIAFGQAVSGALRKIGIDPDGNWELDRKTNDYYWLGGNLFRGVNSGYRTDDPGSNVERVRPLSLPQETFDAAKTWGQNTALLHAKLKPLGNNFVYETSPDQIKEYLDAFLEERQPLQIPMHNTSQKLGEDWGISPKPSDAEYVKQWGQAAKIYALVKTPADRFQPPMGTPPSAQELTKKASRDTQIAQHMSLSIRKALRREIWEAAIAPLGDPALILNLRTAYNQAADPAAADPVLTHTHLDTLSTQMNTLRHDAVRWPLVPNQPQVEAARVEINSLRVFFNASFTG